MVMDASHNLHIHESAKLSSNHPKRNTVACRHFKRGKCLLGDKCAFMHSQNVSGASELEKLCSDRYTWGDESL